MGDSLSYLDNLLTDYNGVTFLVGLLEWDRTFSGFLG